MKNAPSPAPVLASLKPVQSALPKVAYSAPRAWIGLLWRADLQAHLKANLPAHVRLLTCDLAPLSLASVAWVKPALYLQLHSVELEPGLAKVRMDLWALASGGATLSSSDAAYLLLQQAESSLGLLNHPAQLSPLGPSCLALVQAEPYFNENTSLWRMPLQACLNPKGPFHGESPLEPFQGFLAEHSWMGESIQDKLQLP